LVLKTGAAGTNDWGAYLQGMGTWARMAEDVVMWPLLYDLVAIYYTHKE